MRRPFTSLPAAAVVAQLALGAFITAASAGEKALILGVFPEGCRVTCGAFKQAIAESGFAAEIIIRDLSRETGDPAGIVQEARAVKADLVLTVGLDTTLAIVGSLDDAGDRRFLQEIPVVFTGVVDPLESGVAASSAGSGRGNLAGSGARAPLEETVTAIRQLDPDLDRLGFLYNVNEASAPATLEALNSLLPARGIELVALDIEPGTSATPDPALIPVRLAEMAQMGVTWVYLGASPVLQAEGARLAAAAQELGLAIVSDAASLVRDGQALLAVAARPEALGRRAADQALKILRDKARPGALPIAQVSAFAPLVNLELAAGLDREPDSDFALSESVGY